MVHPSHGGNIASPSKELALMACSVG